jgi:hypothetical protein
LLTVSGAGLETPDSPKYYMNIDQHVNYFTRSGWPCNYVGACAEYGAGQQSDAKDNAIAMD